MVPLFSPAAGYGSYNYGGQKLNYSNQGWSAPYASTTQNSSFAPAQTVKINSNTAGGSVNSPSSPVPSTVASSNNNINNAVNDYGNLIEQDFNNQMSSLAGQETSLRGQADTGVAQITNDFSSASNQLGQEQATQTQGVQGQVSTAETGAKTAFQSARDLFRQTQQSNNAQLSALGISSSSVSEALAERLGIETARRISSVSGSLQEVRQNASKEMTRISTYYEQKKTDLEQAKAIQISQIQNSLVQGLNQINSSRDQAATAKASARLTLLNNAQSASAYIQAQTDKVTEALKTWASQKSSALQTITSNPDFLNTLTNTANNFNKAYSPSGFVYTPTVNYDKYGNVTGNVAAQKKPLVDQFGNPIPSGGTSGTVDITDPNNWNN